jgi:damage-control phosphatase, subfamily I
VKLAIAGNVIDLGAKSDLSGAEVLSAMRGALAEPLHGSAQALAAAAARAQNILYLADNAGETVFDRLLLSRLPRGRVTIAVRGRAILNDATLAEAREAGLGAFGPLVENGAAVPGTHLPACSPEFVERFRAADLVISKGQGSFESLWEETAPAFFLFRVKCPIAAAMTGFPLNGNVAMKSPRYRERDRTQGGFE